MEIDRLRTRQTRPSALAAAAALRTLDQCGGPMTILERLSAAQISLRSPPLPLARNS
jgi:hypothetical protein